MIRKAILALLIAPALLVALGTQAALTQDNGETPGAAEVKEEPSAEERVKELEEKVKRLEERVEKLEERLAEATGRERDVAEEPDDAEEADDAEKNADEMDDHWERYVGSFKKGRKWTYEMQGGIQTKQEVIRVDEDKAVIKMTTMMNGNAIGEPQEVEYPLTRTEGEGEPVEGESPEWQEKEIEVKAGTFKCISFDGENWMMKKYPGIMVKSEAIELVEFEE